MEQNIAPFGKLERDILPKSIIPPRQAKVQELEKIKYSSADPVDSAIDKFLFGSKTLIITFIITVTILFGAWGAWNLKNYLKIDIMSGPHHELIDEVNEAFGI